MQPEDLNPEQRSAYNVWRWMGLSESAALNALREDGLLQTTDHDQFTEMFRKVFGMSEGAARVAADGRAGRSARSVSEAGRSFPKPEPGDALRLVRRIEEMVTDLGRRGVDETTAVKDAVYAAVRAMPDDSSADWVAAVAGRRWTGLFGGSASKPTASQKSVRETQG
jgi:hypothetical protein